MFARNSNMDLWRRSHPGGNAFGHYDPLTDGLRGNFNVEAGSLRAFYDLKDIDDTGRPAEALRRASEEMRPVIRLVDAMYAYLLVYQCYTDVRREEDGYVRRAARRYARR